MVRSLVIIILVFGLLWLQWTRLRSSSPEAEAPLVELIQKDLRSPEQPLAKALSQAALIEQNPSPAPTQASVVKDLEESGLDPEALGSQLLDQLNQLATDDLRSRAQLLDALLRAPQSVPAHLGVQIALRQLEIPTAPDLRDQQALQLLSSALQLARAYTTTDQERDELLNLVRPLHPSDEAQKLLATLHSKPEPKN